MPWTRSILAALLLAAAALTAATPARADQDAVQFFHDIGVTPDAPVADAVCFFCNVHVDGQVTGDIVVFFGDVRIDGQAHHDVVNFFGRISAADNSSIGDDAVSIFGGVRLGENVHIGQDLVCIFGSVHAPPSATVGGDRVGIPGLVFYAPLIVIFLLIWVIAHEVRASRRRRWMAGGYPFPPQR
ncbi:MAG TPA: hypothetical protein VHX20_03700 [Terracidiphilus sp.]|jgi:hypothetical protein|nr:hypothetical protein [Terracidiphilus sp.]